MNNKKAYPTKYYIRFITFVIFHIVGFIFRIKRVMPREVKKLKSPYILLSNHVGHWDPFIVGNFLPRFTHFVASDASMRGGFNKFFLTRLGTIPKKKNMRDSKVIRDIISVINQGENIGIFPEAVRTWDGTRMEIDRSTVRLIKMIKVPVIVSVLKGMNLFHPRWSKTTRRTKLEVEYKLMLDQKQVIELSEDEIYQKLLEYIHHDEVEYQRKHMNVIYSDKKAEHIGHALYLCPECNAIDSIRAQGNDFFCSKCNYDIHIDDFGFFERKTEGNLHFDNIRDWNKWQEKCLVNYVNDKLNISSNDILFEDKNSNIYHTTTTGNPDFIGKADVKLFVDRLEFHFTDKKEDLVMKLEELQTISPQINERLEIYYNDHAYRVIGDREGVSALKWEIAVNVIWKNMRLTNKMASYFNI